MTVRMPAERSTRFWGECYGQRQGDDQAYHESQGFRPAVVSHKHHPLSALSRREWLTACLQQTPRRVSPAFFIVRTLSISVNVFPTFAGIFRSFSPVLARIISSQYQTSTACFGTCGRGWAALGLSCSPLCSPTSTPKPRAEGSSPSAPATKPAKTLGFRRFPFFHVLYGYVVHLGSDFGVPHLSAPTAPLSSTQNAPGFAFFGRFRVRFAVFTLF